MPTERVWALIDRFGLPDLEDVAATQEWLGALPDGIRDLHAAMWTQAEVGNGGFAQLFSNSTGILAPEAERGFRSIGMPMCADVVADAVGMFGPTFPRDRDQRNQLLDGMDDHAFDPLDEKFGRLIDEEAGGLVQTFDTYARTVEQ